jgi:hypothetical protein
MLQNRVDPWGRLHAVRAKGMLMGNRGILHDASKRVVRQWARKAWVACELHYKDIRRPELFGKGTYSELFFLDEATSFSAGHRPCAYCRRERFNQFKAAWTAVNGRDLPMANPSIDHIDRRLHAERAARGGRKVSFQAKLDSLPSGTFVEVADSAFLLWKGRLRRWSFEGYREDLGSRPESKSLTVLTPRSVVRMFATGFVPQVDPSAER